MSEVSTTPDPDKLTRRSLEALNRGDFDTATSFYAPNAGVGEMAEGMLARHTWYTDVDEASPAAERLAESRG
jgi:hypothetical protein